MINKELKKKAKEESESRFQIGLSQETRNSIVAVASFGLAVVAILAFVNKAGNAGEFFSSVSKSLFGWGIFLVPVGLSMIGISLLRSISRKIYLSAILGTLLFVFSFLGIFHLSAGGEQYLALERGGYLGLALGYTLFHSFGFTAALVSLIFLLAIAILIALNIPVHAIFSRKKQEDSIGIAPQAREAVVIKRGAEIIKSEEASSVPYKAELKTAKTASINEDKDFVIKMSKSGAWVLPSADLLNIENDKPRSGDINANVTVIKRTLGNFGIDVEMGEVSIGPTVTQYTLRPAVGVKLSKIESLQKDLALALAAHPLRIEAPIPGKALVGIEVPNKKSAIVGLRDLVDVDEFKQSKHFLPISLGRDVAWFPVYSSLEKMPHLLIAGATGSGKSVVLNTILLSLLYKHSPDTLKLILVDPKRVELSLYNGIPHLITPVIVDTKKVVNALKWLVREMDQRYERLSSSGSRDILSYNGKRAPSHKEFMPFIVLVIDELADLMATHGRDVEAAIVRLAQMARAVGIHLIVSTQRPSVEVITGLIKANITTRVALQVASQIDSRTILDTAGAEKLLGHGDMLYQSGDSGARVRRIQGALVTEKEVKDIVSFIKDQAAESDVEEVSDQLSVQINEAVAGLAISDGAVGDELFHEAKVVVIQAGKASASLLQRRLRVGYARAARLLDLLEEKGIIGPGDGAKPREVYVMKDDGSSVSLAAMDSRLDDKIATKE